MAYKWIVVHVDNENFYVNFILYIYIQESSYMWIMYRIRLTSYRDRISKLESWCRCFRRNPICIHRFHKAQPSLLRVQILHMLENSEFLDFSLPNVYKKCITRFEKEKDKKMKEKRVLVVMFWDVSWPTCHVLRCKPAMFRDVLSFKMISTFA